MPTTTGTTDVTVRLANGMVDAIEAYCSKAEVSTGARPSRSDVVRMALYQYLNLKPQNGDDGSEAAPAAT